VKKRILNTTDPLWTGCDEEGPEKKPSGDFQIEKLTSSSSTAMDQCYKRISDETRLFGLTNAIKVRHYCKYSLASNGQYLRLDLILSI